MNRDHGRRVHASSVVIVTIACTWADNLFGLMHSSMWGVRVRLWFLCLGGIIRH